jgi:hypothetical protein
MGLAATVARVPADAVRIIAPGVECVGTAPRGHLPLGLCRQAVAFAIKTIAELYSVTIDAVTGR